MKTKSNEETGVLHCQRRTEHSSCSEYDSGTRPLIEIFNLKEGESLGRETREPIIVYVREGRLILFSDHNQGKSLDKGDLLILPLGAQLAMLTEEGCRFLVWRISDSVRLCRKLDLEGIYDDVPHGYDQAATALRTIEPLRAMLDNFAGLYEEGIRCSSFTESKQNELFFLLQAFYSREMLAGFFSPLLKGDTFFKQRIIKYYRLVGSVDELAEKTNYSRSTFHERFREVFDESPAQWINREKAADIRMELRESGKPIKEIAEEYGFSSVSYFNQFCRKNLGKTPGNIRKEPYQRESSDKF